MPLWETIDRALLGDTLRDMNRLLRELLQQVILPDAEYFVVFDDLDLDFERGDADYTDSIVGLLSATREFHAWARGLGAGAHIIVLLRDDIYNQLYFPDKNKLTDSLVETLVWTEFDDGENPLRAVMDERIRVLLDAPDAEDPWDLVFRGTAPGKQSLYRYMAARTYLRPRDLIKFCNLSLQALHRREEGRDKVEYSDIAYAMRPYSQYLLRELGDEIRVHHPAWESWLELLRKGLSGSQCR